MSAFTVGMSLPTASPAPIEEPGPHLIELVLQA
jgi:hypothetical protein